MALKELSKDIAPWISHGGEAVIPGYVPQVQPVLYIHSIEYEELNPTGATVSAEDFLSELEKSLFPTE